MSEFVKGRLRNAVSKKKRRYQKNGFDLDCAYIGGDPLEAPEGEKRCQILAMGFPATGTQAAIRNPLKEVLRFLDTRHDGKYKVYNLCAEPDRIYEHSRFYDRVEEYGFFDHNAPPFDCIMAFCEDVDAYLKADPENLAAVHCKAGKGRTGLMICCYLLYCGACKTRDEAMQYYAAYRTYNQKGVTIPSQIRYIGYFQEMMELGRRPKEQTLALKTVRVTPPPVAGKPAEWRVNVYKHNAFPTEKAEGNHRPFKKERLLFTNEKEVTKFERKDSKAAGKDDDSGAGGEAAGSDGEEAASEPVGGGDATAGGSKISKLDEELAPVRYGPRTRVESDHIEFDCDRCPDVEGDIKIELFHESKPFWFWFNTAFIHADDEGRYQLEITKPTCDQINKDKGNKIAAEDIKIIATFEHVSGGEGSSKSGGSKKGKSKKDKGKKKDEGKKSTKGGKEKSKKDDDGSDGDSGGSEKSADGAKKNGTDESAEGDKGDSAATAAAAATKQPSRDRILRDLVKADKSGDGDNKKGGDGAAADERSAEGVLNTLAQWPHSSQLAPNDVAIDLLKRVIGLCFGASVDKADELSLDVLAAIAKTERFRKFELATAELQQIKLEALHHQEKLAFWINLFNLLAVHAMCVASRALQSDAKAEPSKLASDQMRKHWTALYTKSAYEVAGHTYTLGEIEHGVLRAVMEEPSSKYFLKPEKVAKMKIGAKKGDPRAPQVLSRAEPRVNFALQTCTLEAPPLRLYEPSTVLQELEKQASSYLSAVVTVDSSAPMATLPRVFQTFSKDFGKKNADVLRGVAELLPLKKRQAILSLLDTMSIKYAEPAYTFLLKVGHLKKEVGSHLVSPRRSEKSSSSSSSSGSSKSKSKSHSRSGSGSSSSGRHTKKKSTS